MTAIHPLSSLAPLPELDLFGVPPTQTSIERDLYTEHRPISILNSSSPIQFEFETAADEYLQFREAMLHMLIQVDIKKTDNTDVVASDWAQVAPVNYWLHSMFKQVDIELNGKSITQSPQTYAYKAYIEQMLAFTDDAKKAHLSGSLYFDDNTADKEALVSARAKFITPDTVRTSGEGKIIDLMGKLHLDLAFQGRALLGGSKVKITLTPNDPTFYFKV